MAVVCGDSQRGFFEERDMMEQGFIPGSPPTVCRWGGLTIKSIAQSGRAFDIKSVAARLAQNNEIGMIVLGLCAAMAAVKVFIIAGLKAARCELGLRDQKRGGQ